MVETGDDTQLIEYAEIYTPSKKKAKQDISKCNQVRSTKELEESQKHGETMVRQSDYIARQKVDKTTIKIIP